MFCPRPTCTTLVRPADAGGWAAMGWKPSTGSPPQKRTVPSTMRAIDPNQPTPISATLVRKFALTVTWLLGRKTSSTDVTTPGRSVAVVGSAT